MAGVRESSSDQQENLRIAAAHLSDAVERDPSFALAHAALSFVSMNIHIGFDPQRKWLQQAEDHCNRALSLDATLPEGHLARAWIMEPGEKLPARRSRCGAGTGAGRTTESRASS